jgi:hypothetical protein
MYLSNYAFYTYGYNFSGVSGKWYKDQSNYGRPPRNSQLGLAGEIILNRPSGSLYGHPECIQPVKESEVLSPSQMIAYGDAILANWSWGQTQTRLDGLPDLSSGMANPGTAVPAFIKKGATTS